MTPLSLMVHRKFGNWRRISSPISSRKTFELPASESPQLSPMFTAASCFITHLLSRKLSVFHLHAGLLDACGALYYSWCGLFAQLGGILASTRPISSWPHIVAWISFISSWRRATRQTLRLSEKWWLGLRSICLFAVWMGCIINTKPGVCWQSASRL